MSNSVRVLFQRDNCPKPIRGEKKGTIALTSAVVPHLLAGNILAIL